MQRAVLERELGGVRAAFTSGFLHAVAAACGVMLVSRRLSRIESVTGGVWRVMRRDFKNHIAAGVRVGHRG